MLSDGRDIDDILDEWPYDSDLLSARLVQACDGRQVIQLRIELGLVQMEIEGRPDGATPGGEPTYLDFLLRHKQELSKGEAHLTEEQCLEIVREFAQYYQRRACWLVLEEYTQVIHDANHSIRLIDFAHQHGPEGRWLEELLQQRCTTIAHKILAIAMKELELNGPEAAMTEIDRVFEKHNNQLLNQQGVTESELDCFLQKLFEIKCQVQDKSADFLTLEDRLAQAISREKYELAATIRDKLADTPQRDSTRDNTPKKAA